MKIQFVILLLTISCFFGCTKKQKVINRMDGTWEIVTYRQTYINGLTSEIESEGTILFTDFNSKKESAGNFQCDQYYTSNGLTTHLYENGTYYPNKKGNHFFVTITNPDGTLQNERDCSINILTTSDLKFQVVFNDVFHTYVLRKK